MTTLTDQNSKPNRQLPVKGVIASLLKQKTSAPTAARRDDDFKLRPKPSSNHLLCSLPEKDRLRLTALCDNVHLNLGEVLEEPGSITSFVFFRSTASFP
jgi:hypothetical protein